jgi:hypothetical protein
MKRKSISLSVVALFAVAVVCFAASDVQMGTWKLNEAKSKLAPGAGKNTTVVYEATADGVKITVDGVDADGKPTHNEWIGKFDGKEYPVTGDSDSDMRVYKQVNEHTLDLTVMKGGKVTFSGKVEVSKDGKTRTVTLKGTDAEGKKIENKAVYDRQ